MTVSIRARFRRSGRRQRPCPMQGKPCFNPRPLPKKRATYSFAACRRLRHVSIRARFRRSGRPVVVLHLAHLAIVSIRARFRRSGRLLLKRFFRTHERVSIRARFRRSGRLVTAQEMRPLICFNPRPLPKKRATKPAHLTGLGHRCFNPRPLPKKRATHTACDRPNARKVSIRARFRRSGRPSRHAMTSPIPMFQSAPASEEAGDDSSGENRLASSVSIRARFRRSGRQTH